MQEENISRFSVDVGTQHKLPIDMSLNSFCQYLAEDYDKNPPSRKLIRGALSALAFDSESSDKSKDTLYDRISENTLVETNGEDSHSTYPHGICWESREFLKAVCKARHTSRTLKDQLLAQKTLDILLKQLSDLPTDDLVTKYTNYQLLRESYFRTRLVESLSPEIDKRLVAIRWLTYERSEEAARASMPVALEQLDALIIELLQIGESSPPKTGKSDPIAVVSDCYNRLVSMHPTLDKMDPYKGKFTFELNDNDQLMQSLNDRFNPPKKKKTSQLSAQELAEMERLFNQYLLTRVKQKFPEEDCEVSDFVQIYGDLKKYLNQDSWENIEPAVRDELREYLKLLFEDINKGEYISGGYSTYESKSADAAYIKILCKNVHEQIGIALHLALRVLQKFNHFHEMIIAVENGVEDSAAASDVLETMKLPVIKWILDAKLVTQKLAEANPEVSLITRASEDHISEVVTAYNDRVSPVLDERLDEGRIKSLFQAASDSPSVLGQFYSTAYLLRVDCHLIACSIVEEAISEIKKTHCTLRSFYGKCHNK